jgi:hypothetical protein
MKKGSRAKAAPMGHGQVRGHGSQTRTRPSASGYNATVVDVVDVAEADEESVDGARHGPANINLVISADKLKYMNAIVNLAAKTCKDLILEVDGEEMTVAIRALNDAKSAYLTVFLRDGFFSEVSLPNTIFSCRIPARPVCTIFGNSRNVEHVCIRTVQDQAASYLVFEQVLYNKITRTHRFTYQECEILNVVFDEANCHLLECVPKMFAKTLGYLYQSPEIRIKASPSALSVSSYHSARVSSDKQHLDTGLTINASEFDRYEFKDDDSGHGVLNFSAKEVPWWR